MNSRPADLYPAPVFPSLQPEIHRVPELGARLQDTRDARPLAAREMHHYSSLGSLIVKWHAPLPLEFIKPKLRPEEPLASQETLARTFAYTRALIVALVRRAPAPGPGALPPEATPKSAATRRQPQLPTATRVLGRKWKRHGEKSLCSHQSFPPNKFSPRASTSSSACLRSSSAREGNNSHSASRRLLRCASLPMVGLPSGLYAG